MFGYTSGSIKQIVFIVPFIEPRSFRIRIFVFLTFDAFFRIGGSETFFSLFDASNFSFDGNHVVIKSGVVDVRVTPVEISLSVVIDKDGRVDVIPTSVA